jgi:hypothetical protein
MSDKQLIDDAFYVEKKRFGTYQSYDKEGNGLVTSLFEEQCISATRFYLKGRQEGFKIVPGCKNWMVKRND